MAGPAAAETIEALRLPIDVPAPLWEAEGIPSERLERTGRSPQRRAVHVVEWVPAGETVEDWTRLHALYAERPVSLPFDARLAEVLAPFEAACRPAPRVRRVRQVAGRAAIEVACPSYVFDPARGEVAVMVLDLSGTVAARVYFEVKGPAFDADDRASWPLGVAAANAEIARLWDGFRLP